MFNLDLAVKMADFSLVACVQDFSNHLVCLNMSLQGRVHAKLTSQNQINNQCTESTFFFFIDNSLHLDIRM